PCPKNTINATTIAAGQSPSPRPHQEETMPIRQRRVTIAVLACTAALTCSQAMAQVPADIAEKIAVIGRVSDPAKTAPLYAPLHQKEPYAGVKITRDVKYGPHERNTLDLFVPEAAGTGRPVFLFVHGGGFIRGSKRQPGSPFYDNV